jgi:hypothetical protein
LRFADTANPSPIEGKINSIQTEALTQGVEENSGACLKIDKKWNEVLDFDYDISLVRPNRALHHR